MEPTIFPNMGDGLERKSYHWMTKARARQESEWYTAAQGEYRGPESRQGF